MQTKALIKLNKEIAKPHDSVIDSFHNYLSDVMNDLLAKGILQENKSLAGSYDFIKSKARSKSKNGVAMIEDSQVFTWLEEYFLMEEKEKPIQQIKKDVAVEKTKEENQMSFGF